MRLALLDTSTGRRLAAVAATGQFVDLQAADPNLPGCIKQLLALPHGLAAAAEALSRGIQAGLFVEGRVLAPIPRPGKVICIGLNYRDHALESNLPIPTEPVCFGKFSQSVIGPGEPIRLPRVSRQVDYEAELVVVIGRRGKHIPVEEAWRYVAGYTNGNDVSARDWQIGRPGGQWLLGKTPDTFAPIGPYLVTADEVPRPHDLAIRLTLNGQVLQQSNTREFIFGIDKVVAHLSQLLTLEPGDIIFTGTPPGVGMARKPQVFLQPGDRVEVEVEGLGTLTNPVEAE